MKSLVCTLALIAACGGDDGGTGGDGGGIPGGVDEPANLAGITAAHNAVRAMVNTSGSSGGPLPPMQWDPDLAAHAAAWAEMCVDTESPSGLVDHSSSSYRSNAAGYNYVGENIFASSNAPGVAQQAVDVWADEKADFTYPNGCSGVCGHYTQIVWRTSVNLGCANVTCNGLQYKGVILCQYGPGGNSGGAPY
jgi:pathogenesis-related protein 1